MSSLLFSLIAAFIIPPNLPPEDNKPANIDYDPVDCLDFAEDFEPYVTDISWFDQWLPSIPIDLQEEDYISAAQELGVDIATLQAVIEIEAGIKAKGFWTEGKPLLCFSTSLFRNNAQRRGINLSRYAKTHNVVFASPNIARFGSHQAAHQAKFDLAAEIDSDAAIESTYWGMFQIAGFNWKRCGTSSPQEFIEKMQRSERDQLNLFIAFIQNTGLDKPLQKHDWASFARGYNGPAYAKRNYHTRLAKSYKKYK